MGEIVEPSRKASPNEPGWVTHSEGPKPEHLSDDQEIDWRVITGDYAGPVVTDKAGDLDWYAASNLGGIFQYRGRA